MSKPKWLCGRRRAPIRPLPRLGTISPTYWMSRDGRKRPLICLRKALLVSPDYVDAMFNLACCFSERANMLRPQTIGASYSPTDRQSEWATRARRSLKFCEMQGRLVASA